MRKAIKFLMMAAIVFGFAACNNEEGPDVPTKGNTYASVSVALKGIQTRALTDNQSDNAGTPAEQVLTTLEMLSTAGNATWASATSGSADGTFWSETGIYKTAPWATTPGAQTMALIFNKNSVTPGAATATATTEYSGALSGLTTPNFTMTSKAFNGNIQPNITKDACLAGTDQTKNVFTGIEVERVVAKGIVRQAADFSGDVMQGTTKVATVDGLTFAAVNGATKTYLFRDNAGSRIMEVADNNQYTGYKSAIHAIVPTQDADAAVAAGLVRLGVAGVPAEVSEEKEVNAAGATVEDVNTEKFYFMENSGDLSSYSEAGGAIEEQGFYRFAYAKVYGYYTPEKVLTVDGTAKNFVAKAGTGKWYNPTTFVAGTEGDGVSQEGYLVYALKELVWGSAKKGTTFYMGIQDGVLYETPDAAASSTSAPGQFAYTYKDGKCGYRALWNRQTLDTDDKVVVNASTRRNNAYMLDIKGFAKIGFPWDSSDPNDPNLPKEDPDSPNYPDPDDPNIEPTETYMRVEAVVLPWNLVQRGGIVLQ